MTAPAHAQSVEEAIAALEWAEVHHSDGRGRCIVTIEAETSEAGIERLKVLKRIPGVLAAELVIHCFEDEAAAQGTAGADPEQAAARLNREDELPPPSHFSRLKAWSNF
jgi:nitrate reductase NapAB chaperone NapD